MPLDWKVKLFSAFVIVISAFGLWLLRDERNDPWKVLGVCLALASAAVTLLVVLLIIEAAHPIVLENLGYGNVER